MMIQIHRTRPPVARVYHGAEATCRCSFVDERLLVTMEHFIVQECDDGSCLALETGGLREPSGLNSAVGTQLGSRPEKH
jgi:hypothetical protein